VLKPFCRVLRQNKLVDPLISLLDVRHRPEEESPWFPAANERVGPSSLFVSVTYDLMFPSYARGNPQISSQSGGIYVQ
jgi:hypothetical protein